MQDHTEQNTHIKHTGATVDQEITGGFSGTLDTIMFSNIINVLIVILFFIWLFRKFNLLSFISKKREGILQKIKNLEEERLFRQNQLKQTKTRVQNVAQEIHKLVDEGEHVAESISERIISEAEEEATGLQKKAHSILESEGKVASIQLTREVTTAAFVVAEQHIKDAINDSLHQKYINEFIDNLDNVKV